MTFRSTIRTAAGAALLANAVPHGVSAVQGRAFPSPFGDPPGVGLSSPTVNVGWSVANAVAGTLLLSRGIRTVGECIAAVVGAAGMALVLARHFGAVTGGDKKVRRSRR